MNVSDLIALSALTLGILSSIAAVFLWYANSEKRKYGLERDFNHLKLNYEQINSNLGVILTEMDRRFDTIERDTLEIKANLNLPMRRKRNEED